MEKLRTMTAPIYFDIDDVWGVEIRRNWFVRDWGEQNPRITVTVLDRRGRSSAHEVITPDVTFGKLSVIIDRVYRKAAGDKGISEEQLLDLVKAHIGQGE
jgi:hypothetical protein